MECIDFAPVFLNNLLRETPKYHRNLGLRPDLSWAKSAEPHAPRWQHCYCSYNSLHLNNQKCAEQAVKSSFSQLRLRQKQTHLFRTDTCTLPLSNVQVVRNICRIFCGLYGFFYCFCNQPHVEFNCKSWFVDSSVPKGYSWQMLLVEVHWKALCLVGNE